MVELDREALRHALTAVGELLANENESVAIVVTGGATLSLLGIVDRATSDVDVIARARRGEAGTLELEPPEPFPDALERAIRTVARDFELDEDWMNAVVGMQWSQGLPPWFGEEIEWTNYGGGLDVGAVGRRTLIALKLFAAVDQGPKSIHFDDLQQLVPSDTELDEARDWVLTQDAAPRWSEMVDEVVAHAKRHC